MSLAAQIAFFFALALAAILAVEWGKFASARRLDEGGAYPLGRLARRAGVVLLLECALALVVLAGRFGGSPAGLKRQLLCLSGGLVLALAALLAIARDLRQTRARALKECEEQARRDLERMKEILREKDRKA